MIHDGRIPHGYREEMTASIDIYGHTPKVIPSSIGILSHNWPPL
jgi:hypothetical protein